MGLSWNQIRFFRETGYLRMPGEVPSSDVREMRDIVLHQIRDAVEPVRRNKNGDVWRLDKVIDRGEVFRRVFLESSTILDSIESLLGPNIEFMLSPHNHATINLPRLAETRLHRDVLQWSSTILTAIVYLENATEVNGCTHVVPTTHRLPGVVKPNNGGMWVNDYAEFDDFQTQSVPVPMPSGGVLLMDGFVFHATGQNRSNRLRPIVTMGYRCIDELVQVRDPNMVLIRGQYVYKGR